MPKRVSYVPILKGREGEYAALESLAPGIRQALTPVVEIPPIAWDFVEEVPEKTVDEHLQKVGLKIERAWGVGQRIFIDLLWIPDSERMADGTHPLSYVFNELRTRNIEAVPVLGLFRGDDYVEACRGVAEEDGRGVCVRIQREDFIEFPDLREAVASVLKAVAAAPDHCDLVLDLRAVNSSEPDLDVPRVIDLINRLPFVHEWRTLTLASTSFPQNLTGLPASNLSFIKRQEWNLWTELSGQAALLKRVPRFGDYAISHPEPAEVDPRIMRPSASIRYTTKSCWLILKAKNLRDHGYSQFRDVCRVLVQKPEYCRPAFSWGDQYIESCANGSVGTGNLTTWRKVGTSHHLTYVVRQLANQRGS